MKTAAIIAEYNPFHNGHRYHIQQTRQKGATHIVAIMSPNFVQRGECAMFEKRVRTEAALRNGVDLVIELPAPYALSCAELFAANAVSIIESLGCIDLLSFGSECSDLALLDKAASLFASPELNEQTAIFLQKGYSYPKARHLAAEQLFGAEVAALAASPNNTLAIEYLKSLQRNKSKIQPLAIHRAQIHHDSGQTQAEFASALALRKMFASQQYIIAQNYLPDNAFDAYNKEICQNTAPCVMTNLEKILFYRLRQMTKEELRQLPDISEGLENRIIKSAVLATDWNQLLTMIKNKRYTMARIRRILCCALNDITKEDVLTPPPYIRVLGFNQNGSEVLKRMKETASLPCSVSLAKLAKENRICERFAEIENRCTDNFLLASPKISKSGYEYTQKSVIIR